MVDVVLDLEGVMKRLVLSRAEIYRLVKDGKLKGETAKGDLHFSEADVAVFESTRNQVKTTLIEALDFWLDLYEKRLPIETSEVAEDNETPDVSIEESEKDVPTPSDEERIKGLVQKIVTDGMACGASDIYLDPLRLGDRILYRSDGRLHGLGTMISALSEPVKTQLKTLGNLVTKEDDRGFMEGIFAQSWKAQAYQIRIVTAPTLLGEHIHLHFYAEDQKPDLVDLGYTPLQADVMEQLLTGQPGLLIAAGAADPQADRHRLALANTLAEEGRLVVSLEHRVHYRSEILVQLKIGDALEFESVMETVLGMRPDVVIFDDVRDKAEADALIETVLSGAMVVAQVRVAGFIEAVLHLVDLGVNKEGLARVLLGGVERRTLRRLCVHCRIARETKPEDRILLGEETTHVFDPNGCDVCGDGFLGWTRRFGVWLVDTAFLREVRTTERPGASLIQWRAQNALSLADAVKAAAICGDVAFKDVQALIVDHKESEDVV
jgi:type II secretory ATPase GspE/PulE/Tfp pilus assembly ATPase PilB-like protein